jgi:hypothetical protein
MMASPAFVHGTALKRDRLLGGIGMSLAREMRFGVGSSLRPGVTTLAQDAMRTLDTTSLTKGIRADLAGLTPPDSMGLQREQARVFDLSDAAKDMRAALGVNASSKALLAKTDTASLAKRMSADIASLSPLAVGGIDRDAMRSLGTVGIGKDFTGILGLNASARDLFGGIGTASLAKQMALDNAQLMNALRSAVLNFHENLSDEAFGSEATAEPMPLDTDVLQWLRRLPVAGRWKLFLAFVGFCEAVEGEMEAGPMDVADSVKLHIYAAVAVVAFVWALVEADRH